MLPNRVVLSALIMAVLCPLANAQDALRIQSLQRCGDLLAGEKQEWCLQVRGLGEALPKLRLGEDTLPAAAVQRSGDTLRLQLNSNEHRSAPLWLEDGARASNPVWLSLHRSHVLAAGPDEVAKNMDGLTTYVDLVSLLIEESHDGLDEARRLAKKYDAKVVGAIPPLNVYQLRLPVKILQSAMRWCCASATKPASTRWSWRKARPNVAKRAKPHASRRANRRRTPRNGQPIASWMR